MFLSPLRLVHVLFAGWITAPRVAMPAFARSAVRFGGIHDWQSHEVKFLGWDSLFAHRVARLKGMKALAVDFFPGIQSSVAPIV
jgi:hypothetical protein